MISLINKKVWEEKFPNLKMHSVDEFMGTEVKLSAANQTELQIDGIVLVDFGIKQSEVLFQIPFIVTEEDVKDIIIGYNVIENLIVNCNEQRNAYGFLSEMTNTPGIGIEGIVNQIRAKLESPEIRGEVKVSKNQAIPANCVHRVKCKTKVEGESLKNLMLFSPKDNLELNNLDLMETPETVMGRKQNLCISVHNSSGENIWLKKGCCWDGYLKLLR